MKTLRIAVLVALGAAAFGCSSEASDTAKEQEAPTDSDSTTAGETTDGGNEPGVCSLDVTCGEQAYCDYPDDSCGADGATGVCVPYPLECGPSPLFCNCEGEVTTCRASDVSRAGGCELGPLQLACGDKVCSIDHEICVELKADAWGAPHYACYDYRSPPCAGDAPCDCTSFTQVCPYIAVGAQMESCDETNAETGGSITLGYTVFCVL